MRRIPMADASFLYFEKRETPMHVGGLHLLTLPDEVKANQVADYLQGLMDVLCKDEEYRPPFEEYVTTGRTGALGPLYWERDDNFDIDYHVRHSALPEPGRYRELFMLVSRLHSTLLDRSRPLWETHLIEGLENRQFALYLKIHHAAIDGAAAMHMVNAMYSTRKSDRAIHSPYSLELYEQYKASRKAERQNRVIPKPKELRNIAEILRDQLDATTNLASAVRQMSGALIGRGGGLALPFIRVPRSSINQEISGSRRFVAQSWDFDRIRAIAKAVDGTINDIVLAMCGTALRRYMLEFDTLPKESMKAMTPVSLRDESDLDSANLVSFLVADLATNLSDPEARLRKTQESMNAGKQLMKKLTRREIILLTQLIQVPALITSIFRLGSKFPAFSTTISNVPGPREQLYWNGARLDGIYPVSIPVDGWAVNISLISYNRGLHFGITACRRSMPQVQRMIDYLEESVQELEVVAGLASPKAATKTKSTGRKSTSSTTKAAANAGSKKAPKAKTAAKKKKAASTSAASKSKARPKSAASGS